MKAESIDIVTLGAVDYDTAITLQTQARARVCAGTTGGVIFFLEHDPPVITLGRHARPEHVRLNERELNHKGYQLRRSSRGGDVTVHEKGQLVMYVVVPVKSKGAGPFIDCIAGVLTTAITDAWGLETRYRADNPGLWIEDRKVGSMGFDLSGGVSMHGVAINICNSLEGFSLIDACGCSATVMTTLERETGSTISISDAVCEIMKAFRNGGIIS